MLFSTLYPSSARPSHGIFVETRLRELLKLGGVEARVIAPVPWFPFTHRMFGEYANYAATPLHELRNGIEVSHPRYPLPPRVGMNHAPKLLEMGAWGAVKRFLDGGFDFDLIDAHYYYPDGVAAAAIARRLGKPFVVTARGTDLNLIPAFERPRRQIVETAARASASVGVCEALIRSLAGLGADPSRLHVFRNGVDLERFRPESREAARAHIGEGDGRLWISVGQLIERKGHHMAVEALASRPRDRLIIVGEGPERRALADRAARLGVLDRVRFAGAVPNHELRWWYSAADGLLLCSSREGWANVLLESMACGTPAIATPIWGTPEVVSSPDAGILMADRSVQSLLAALEQLERGAPTREAVRRHAEQFGWQDTSEAQLRLFREVLGRA